MGRALQPPGPTFPHGLEGQAHETAGHSTWRLMRFRYSMLLYTGTWGYHEDDGLSTSATHPLPAGMGYV